VRNCCLDLLLLIALCVTPFVSADGESSRESSMLELTMGPGLPIQGEAGS
jgi:hypothetical protein